MKVVFVVVDMVEGLNWVCLLFGLVEKLKI